MEEKIKQTTGDSIAIQSVELVVKRFLDQLTDDPEFIALIDQEFKIDEQMEKLSVTDDRAEVAWNDNGNILKETLDKFEALRKQIVKPIDISRDMVQNFFKYHTKRPKENIEKVNNAVKNYIIKKERKREEEQKRLDEEAKKKAEEEKKKLLKQAQEAKNTGDLQAALDLTADAQAIDHLPAPSPYLPEVKKTVVSESGKTTAKKIYKIEIINKRELLKAIVEGKFPTTFIKVDEGIIKKYITSFKVFDIPGIEIKEDISLARSYKK